MRRASRTSLIPSANVYGPAKEESNAPQSVDNANSHRTLSVTSHRANTEQPISTYGSQTLSSVNAGQQVDNSHLLAAIRAAIRLALSALVFSPSHAGGFNASARSKAWQQLSPWWLQHQPLKPCWPDRRQSFDPVRRPAKAAATKSSNAGYSGGSRIDVSPSVHFASSNAPTSAKIDANPSVHLGGQAGSLNYNSSHAEFQMRAARLTLAPSTQFASTNNTNPGTINANPRRCTWAARPVTAIQAMPATPTAAKSKPTMPCTLPARRRRPRTPASRTPALKAGPITAARAAGPMAANRTTARLTSTTTSTSSRTSTPRRMSPSTSL